MSEPSVTHEVVGLDGGIDVGLVNTNGHSHEHVLWSLNDLTLDLEEVGSFESLETEVVVVVISLVIQSSL